MSLRVRVRRGDVELEVSGNKDEITSAISTLKDAMSELASLLGEKGSTRVVSLPVSGAPNDAHADQDEVPTIGKTSGGSEAIVKLLSSRWGDKPRGIGELRLALDSNAMPIPTTTISGLLHYLVKAGKVKRWKTKAGYVYRVVEAQN